MSDYDSPWKEALDVYFDAFVAFFFPVIHSEIDWSRGYEPLDKELQKVAPDAEIGRRYADKLVKVWRTNGQEELILIHIEVQGGMETGFPERMFVYNCRLSDRYNKTVVSLAILADEQPDWHPDSFQRSLWGCTVDFRFPTVKLLDYAAQSDKLEVDENPFAIFVLAHLKALETRQDDQTRYNWKVRLIRGLFEHGLAARDVRHLFRLVDWVMELPADLAQRCRNEVYKIEEEKKMPYVTSFERLAKEEGLEEGLEQGLEKGLERGLEQGMKAAIRTVLQSRLGEHGLQLMPEIERISDMDVLQSVLNCASCATSPDEIRESLKNG